jgi:hypothetical protein
MGLEVLFAAIYVVAAAVTLWSRAQVGAFLADTPSIATEADLDRFKELARLEMYLALTLIVLLGAGIVTGLVLVKRYGIMGLLVVILVNVVVFGLGMLHKGIEDKAKNLPATDALKTEYRRVCYAWAKKVLPNF